MSEASKSCIHCRYTKCLNIGMRPELVRGKRKKKDESRDLERELSESEDSDVEEPPEERSNRMSDSDYSEGLLVIN